jgi:hypothetical protein
MYRDSRTCMNCEMVGRDKSRLTMRLKRRAMRSCRKVMVELGRRRLACLLTLKFVMVAGCQQIDIVVVNGVKVDWMF